MFPAFFFYQVINTRFKYVVFKALHKTIFPGFRIGFIYMFIIEYNINSPIFITLYE